LQAADIVLYVVFVVGLALALALGFLMGQAMPRIVEVKLDPDLYNCLTAPSAARENEQD
jgi:hypothetical protein